jgi:hypothetical protein
MEDVSGRKMTPAPDTSVPALIDCQFILSQVGDNTYKSSLNDNILGWGLLVEITYPRWIYEDQIVAFLKYRKQMIDSRNRIHRRGLRPGLIPWKD